MSDNKIRTIHNCLELKKVKNIQSFLGFANFYHRFIFNYSDIIILLMVIYYSTSALFLLYFSTDHTPFHHLSIQGLKTLYSFQFHGVLNDNPCSAQQLRVYTVIEYY